ncbi:MAG TPA: serine hydrolase, partial [Candidatus Binataceae bacterium]|nr:serine hydrolase [Candidatus Binataceae bacterium]
RSTAGDLVTYLEANLHPDKVATDASAGSPSATLPAAFVLAHKVRADGFVNNKIALAWWFNSQAGVFFHGGGSGFGGYSSHVQFNPAEDRAIVVLYNRFDSTLGQLRFVERVAENVDELLSGNPTIPVDRMSDIDKATLADAKGAQ